MHGPELNLTDSQWDNHRHIPAEGSTSATLWPAACRRSCVLRGNPLDPEIKRPLERCTERVPFARHVLASHEQVG
jgi:hypothetical protein